MLTHTRSTYTLSLCSYCGNEIEKGYPSFRNGPQVWHEGCLDEYLKKKAAILSQQLEWVRATMEGEEVPQAFVPPK
jgi:hypothetical protein